MTERIRLDDPRRADIIFELTGQLPTGAGSRLQNVAEPTVVDGHRFPSKKEANRYCELKYAERSKERSVRNLELQVLFPLVVKGVAIFPRGYYADFVYIELQPAGTWELIVEDAKGVRTDTYRVKANLVKAIYGIEIRET